MASVVEVVEGLEILAKTATVPDRLHCRCGRTAQLNGAGHDIIYGPDADPSAEDKQLLAEIGWHYEEECESWSLFV